MYALIINGVVSQYPYSFRQLNKDNPQTSFPKHPSDELLANWNVLPVAETAQPAHDSTTKRVDEISPVFANGRWERSWVVRSKTAEEIEQYTIDQANSVRTDRNALLTASDWTQVADAPVDQAAWATYRQALRDITAQDGFPHNVTWPIKP